MVSSLAVALYSRSLLGFGSLLRFKSIAAALLLGLTGFMAGCGGGDSNVAANGPTLTSISLSPLAPSLSVGNTLVFTATGLYSDGSRQYISSLTWSSSAPEVASIVGASGVATAVASGSTTITVASGSISASTTLTVTGAALVSIGVTPAIPSIALGTRQQFTATGVYSDNSKQNLTNTVTWVSATPDVATISNAAGTQGLASAVSAGATQITATLGAVSGSATLTVTAATLASIGVTPAIPSIALGTQQQFTATGVYSDNSKQNLTDIVTWNSTSPAVATISNAAGTQGLASPVATGSTTITATSGIISGSTALTVTAATLVSIAVTPPNATIVAGTTQQLTATGTYSDHHTQNITTLASWTSSLSSIAAVSVSGGQEIATAASPGTVTITAVFDGISGTTPLTVTNATIVSIQVTPAKSAIAKGTTQQFAASATYDNGSTQTVTDSVVWSSSVPAVATISNATSQEGLASALTEGATVITATLGSVSGSTPLTVTAATLVSIGVTPSIPRIALGTQQQFTATGVYTDNSKQDLTASVTWSAIPATPVVATISNAAGSEGLATPVAAGSTQITAVLGTVSGSTTMTVPAATLVSISVTPATPSIAAGTQQQFTATGVYSDNSTQNLTATVTWASSTPGVATISNAAGTQGLASSTVTGSTTITAASGSTTSPGVALTVTAATLVSIAVTPATPSIAAGTQLQFTATGTFSDSTTQDLTDTVSWISATPAAATISNATGTQGLATSSATGSTTITATLGSVPGSTTLTVTAATLVSIAVTPGAPSVVIDNNLQLSATGTYTDSSTQPITATATWTSSSTTVAAISSAAGSSGLATGEAKGTTMITAASGSITSPPITLTVIIEYVYATSFAGNGVSQYTVGPGGGLVPMTPASVGPPYVFGASLIAVDPTQHFVYVVNYTTPGSVSEYSIGATGALTFLNSMTTGTGSSSDGIAIDPSGPYLYVPNFYVPGGTGDGTVSQFVIQPDGTLAANTAGAEVAAGSGPSSVAVNAAGTVAYVPNASDNTVSVYSIGTGVGVGGGTAGALTQTGTASLAAGSSSSDYLAIDPTGAYAYVSSQSGSTIQLFDISAADGSLTAAMGLPLSLPAGSEPTELTLGGAAGNYLYAPAYGLSELYQLSIGAGGALTLLNTTIMPNGTYPSFIAVDASGQFAYVSNRGAVGSGTYGTTISQYSIGTGGLLTPLSTPTAPSGTQPVGIATAIQY